MLGMSIRSMNYDDSPNNFNNLNNFERNLYQKKESKEMGQKK